MAAGNVGIVRVVGHVVHVVVGGGVDGVGSVVVVMPAVVPDNFDVVAVLAAAPDSVHVCSACAAVLAVVVVAAVAVVIAVFAVCDCDFACAAAAAPAVVAVVGYCKCVCCRCSQLPECWTLWRPC